MVELAIFTVASVFGITVWSIRLEGRVNNLSQRQDDLKELINSRFDDIDARLSRIERSMNGFLHRD